jgi:hypothetical protein
VRNPLAYVEQADNRQAHTHKCSGNGKDVDRQIYGYKFLGRFLRIHGDSLTPYFATEDNSMLFTISPSRKPGMQICKHRQTKDIDKAWQNQPIKLLITAKCSSNLQQQGVYAEITGGARALIRPREVKTYSGR